MVRTRVVINVRKERRKLVQKSTNNWNFLSDEALYQQKLESFINEQNDEEINVEALNTNITNAIKKAEETCRQYGNPPQKNNKISANTKQLMQRRRDLTDKHTTNATQLRQLNKEISKSIRKDLRTYNTNEISRIIEANKGTKCLRKTFQEGRKNISKLKNANNQITSNKTEILNIVENFYATLYSDQKIQSQSRRIPKVENQGSEEIPDISIDELRTALREMKNNKTPGDDDIAIEAIKKGGNTILLKLCQLFNACLLNGVTPSQWDRAIIIILHKKGDITNLENYRPISLLSHIYKLFMRVITKRITTKLDFYQPREQAGFRTGYSTNDHLQVVKTLIEKCVEYNKPLFLVFVDYEKAFDTINQHEMLIALTECRVDHRYIALIKNVYDKAKACVRLHENTNDFNIERGVRQGDVISPKLFTTLLEYMFKKINFGEMGININGEKLNHLRFADDILLITERVDEAREMLSRLETASKSIGLKINTNKTQYMTNLVVSGSISIGENNITQVTSYKYLGHEICIGRDNQTREINRRIGLTWSAFGKLRNVFKANIPVCLKRKTFNQCVLPVLTYGAETLTLTKNTVNRIQIAQRRMERSMLSLSLRDRISNARLRQMSGVTDAIERITTLKWNWAGHVARFSDNRWTKRILEWRPLIDAQRSRGRPPTRWSDDIKRLETNWISAAQDRRGWINLREAYVQQWTQMAV